MASPKKLTSIKLITLLVCAVFSFSFIYTVSAQTTTVNAGASTSQPAVGSTLTITITISNVQNLFGLDVALVWNPSVLSLSNVVLNVGDSQSSGVLHGTINRDYNTIAPGDLFVNETKMSGSYNLIAQSFGHDTPSYTGSGIIATLTFNVKGTGTAGLSLTTELADQAILGQNANNIDHQDIAASVTAVAAGSSSSPSSSPRIPELPAIMVIAILLSFAIAASILAITRINTRKIESAKI